MKKNYLLLIIVFALTLDLYSEYDGTPAGGKTVDMYYYMNSLFNHAQPGSAANSSTDVGNWIARMISEAPTPNVATLGSMFGFFTGWSLPPTGNGYHSEISTPYINGQNPSWTGAQNIELVGFVPDNFDGQAFDPSVPTNMGAAYQTRLLYYIDQWETNAPNANRRYIIYTGWPVLNGYGGSGDNPATITPANLARWRTYGIGDYQTWMELLVARLKSARPTLDIRLHNINIALLMTYANTVVGTIPLNVLFEDLAPHGRPTWYFLAAVAEYIEVFNEKPPVSFSFNTSWNVAPEVTTNYQEIVDYIWTILKSSASTGIERKANETTTLLSNYPNPFNSCTTIRWQASKSDFAELMVFDVLGRKVITLIDNYITQGEYCLNFDSKDLPSGTYFYQLKMGNHITTNKMLIMR